MAKEKESVIKPIYDVSVYNKYYNTSTIYKGATLKFLIESLKKLDGNTKTNAKVGTDVKGRSKNSKNCKPTPNMKI
tara:strand:+ start:482 stop:709 length:228 start_codon:yes stop_codon:yes gene_type:complete